MTTTPRRRSTRTARAPERLEPAATTPRKRGKAAGAASALPQPRPASAKRQRTGRARRAVADDGTDSDGGSGSDEDVQVSDSGAESDESSFGRRGRAARTPRRAKGGGRAPRAKGSRAAAAAAIADAESDGSSGALLLEALQDEAAAVGQVAADWLEAYRGDSDAALCELVGLFIRLAGGRAQIGGEALNDTDGIAAALEAVQAQTIARLRRAGGEDGAGGEVLVGRTREQRALRRSALQLVQRIVVDGQHTVLAGGGDDDGGQLPEFVEAAVQWLASMAASSYRPFRHAATLVALALQTALVSVRAQAAAALQTAQRQADARRSTQHGARLRARVAELEAHDAAAAAAFEALYATVFIYRYRDVHAAIRAECLAPLAAWCRALPAAFLDTEHLRFLGWALNDRDARVREAALAAIAGPLVQGVQPPAPGTVGSGVGAPAAVAGADAAVAEGVRPFVARFLGRLVQVAAGDVDARVQAAALRLVALLARRGLVDAGAKIGDIRAVGSSAARDRPRARASAASAFGASLSQQLLEESGSESDAAEPDAALLAIQVLDDDSGSSSSSSNADGVLACPRHSAMRYLAPLVTHTHAAVRAAAGALVAWWLAGEWTVAARVAALGVDRTIDNGNDDDDNDNDDDEDGAPERREAEIDAETAVDDVLASAAGRRRARQWLVFRAVGAFLCHVSRRGAGAGSAATDAAEWWVQEQAAACAEELWAAPAAALASGAHRAALAGAAADGLAPTALDARIEAAADTGAAPARLVAAAQALWPCVPELADLGALAAFLAWDHSARSGPAAAACFALAAPEQDALLHALAVWAAEHRAAEHRARAKARRDAPPEPAAAAAAWQPWLVPLLARHIDSPARLAPLLSLAAGALDLQGLFDAGRSDVIAATAGHAAAVLERHARHVRLARLAALFIERVDDSRLLPGSAAAADDDSGDSAPGPLVSRAAAAAAAQLESDPGASVPALRALIRTKDASPLLLDAADRLVALAERPADCAMAVSALDAAFRFVLWRALRLDRTLARGGGAEAEAEAEAARLMRSRDRILDVCLRLVRGSSGGTGGEEAGSGMGGLLREHAFAVLGRVQRLFTGPLTSAPASAEIRRSLAVPAQPAPLADFYAGCRASWARLVAHLGAPESESEPEGPAADELRWYRAAPSSWSIAYARFCAASGLWAQWLGDQTVAPEALAAIAAHTGMLGLEPVERRRVERLALAGNNDDDDDSARAAPKRKVGFVPLSAFDHIVQAAVDALKPQLSGDGASIARVAEAYMGAMRAALDQYTDALARKDAAADPVNVGTLARFVGAALRATGAGPQQQGARRGGRVRADATLAPAAVGAAWAQCHTQAIDYALAAADGAQREARAGPWFVALAQTVAGVLRPRHAEALDAQLKERLEALGDGGDDDAARAAVAPYQRALDKELAKLGAVKARMAEAQAEARALAASGFVGRSILDDDLPMDPPTSPVRAAMSAMDIE